MLTTTLKKLRQFNSCADRYKFLSAALGADYGDDTPISFLKILEINGSEDTIWALRVIEPPELRRKILGEFAWRCAVSVEGLSTDPRVKACNATTRRYLDGEIPLKELKAAASAAVRYAASAAEREKQAGFLREVLEKFGGEN